MKNLTTTIIALFTITSLFANTTNLTTTSVVNTATNNCSIAINFIAATNTSFEIERSFYSNYFTVIASGKNVLVSNTNFIINDNAAELAGRKIAYYRVKTINSNGTVTYSNTNVVNLTATEGSIVNKNTINFTAAQNGNVVIEVKNAAGKIVTVKNSIASRGNNTVELTKGLAKGFYTATISVNGITVDIQKVIAE